MPNIVELRLDVLGKRNPEHQKLSIVIFVIGHNVGHERQDVPGTFQFDTVLVKIVVIDARLAVLQAGGDLIVPVSQRKLENVMDPNGY